MVDLWDVYFTLNLLIGLLVPTNLDRLPSGVAIGYTPENAVAPFPWVAIVQYGLGLVAVAFLVYVFWRRWRT